MWYATIGIVLTVATSAALAQQGGGRGGPPPAATAPRPKAIFPDADPVRSCESLTSVALPDTTIDSAAVDKGDERTPASCRVIATVTHPPAGDRVKIFLAFPMERTLPGHGRRRLLGRRSEQSAAAADRRLRSRVNGHGARGRQGQFCARRERQKAVHGAWRRALWRRCRSSANRPVRSGRQMGRGREGAGDARRRQARPIRDGCAIAPALSVSVGRALQRAR
jgi:hypothetical protein